SFEGLAEPWIFRREGAFSVDGLPEVRENVQLVKGWFAETLRAFLKEHTETCAFIHIDCDVYSSAKTVLGCLEQRIAAGTVIVFDEFFNYPGWREGEYKAFMEFVDQIGARFEYVGYTYQKTDKHRSGQQVAVKLTGFG
ncbi:MAG: class I SAM-dependent methyltransferase, partial [Candidatus Brocadiia bacterium]|nr:class I SAM-dependent methyltransferase [Candidatus Brocadiia bacterium]